MTSIAARRPFWQRLVFALPVFGWILKDYHEGQDANIWYHIITVVSLWLISGLTFGIVGIAIPAVMAVPVMFLVLVLISRG
ncbi:hypothetical protein PSA7680_01649 [Pseudoruegeria aquimaris]|uniref:Uncharacterized protein n=1 Tax=Pseudoruegeria aquimaris TaxID=393663 RepID=A0A1Y5S8Q6_9RHOB|nr:hypothetical protein [Pseudoruegeria aquimaris]SLN34908.1 hypothetical protein PSA7680_01649 [Pseudoruegeria aquimaris]